MRYLVTEYVVQASGYVLDDEGKRVDRFTYSSPVLYEQEALDDLLAGLDAAIEERATQIEVSK